MLFFIDLLEISNSVKLNISVGNTRCAPIGRGGRRVPDYRGLRVHAIHTYIYTDIQTQWRT